MKKFDCYLFLLILTCSCNSLTAPVEIDISDIKSTKKIAVHVLLLNTDTILYAKIDNAIGISDTIFVNDNSSFIDDPLIDSPDLDLNIFDELNNTIVNFHYIPKESRSQNFKYNYITDLSSKPLGKLGEKLILSVKHSNLGEVLAEQIMPKPVPILFSRVILDAGFNERIGSSVSGVEILFDDPLEEENYYEVRIVGKTLKNNPLFQNEQISIYSDNPILKSGYSFSQDRFSTNDAYYISDENINGSKFSFMLLTDKYIIPEGAKIIWRSITKDWYLFVTQLNKQSNFRQFSEPFNLHSNIENGFGIFGLAYELQYPIEN